MPKGTLKKIVGTLGRGFVLFLLLVYTVSSLKLNSVHQLFHEEEIAELHSIEKENDPCHKNIYHQQKQSGCEHKSHITGSTKCPLCEHHSNSKEILTQGFADAGIFQSLVFTFHYKEKGLSSTLLSFSGRGPPQV